MDDRTKKRMDRAYKVYPAILSHTGKHGSLYWLVSSHEELLAALRTYIIQYHENWCADDIEGLSNAINGSPRDILEVAYVLGDHEYGGWAVHTPEKILPLPAPPEFSVGQPVYLDGKVKGNVLSVNEGLVEVAFDDLGSLSFDVGSKGRLHTTQRSARFRA